MAARWGPSEATGNCTPRQYIAERKWRSVSRAGRARSIQLRLLGDDFPTNILPHKGMQKGTGLRGHPVTILSSLATFEGMSLSELYMSHKPPIAHTFAISYYSTSTRRTLIVPDLSPLTMHPRNGESNNASAVTQS